MICSTIHKEMLKELYSRNDNESHRNSNADGEEAGGVRQVYSQLSYPGRLQSGK